MQSAKARIVYHSNISDGYFYENTQIRSINRNLLHLFRELFLEAVEDILHAEPQRPLSPLSGLERENHITFECLGKHLRRT